MHPDPHLAPSPVHAAVSSSPAWPFDHSYARDLPGCYAECRPVPVRAPRGIYLNRPLAQALGLDPDALASPEGVAVLAGNHVPPTARPLAQAYAGHQFGGFSPQLGDGRALLLGELIDSQGQRRDLVLKGSGRTPFSRNGDGRAALGPMLREVLISEALHALGVPTTRSLAVVATGEPVRRTKPLPGAVLARVAASHLRVGTFQYFAARGDRAALQMLLDYTLRRHHPEGLRAPEPALALLSFVAHRQAELIAQWLNLGFIHGVMNTDNMTLSGETIDYGPCAFLEAYDPATVFSSIDHGGRYAYGKQAAIAQWNLARLAETLLPLLIPEAAADEDAAVQHAIDRVTEPLSRFEPWHASALLRGQRAKLGLTRSLDVDDETDPTLAADWLSLLQDHRVDFTLAWRHLADAAEGRPEALQALIGPVAQPRWQDWLRRWEARCASEDATPEAPNARATRMRAANPLVIPRNHAVEAALEAASEDGDLAPFERLLSQIQDPYEAPSGGDPDLLQPAPARFTATYQTFCGT